MGFILNYSIFSTYTLLSYTCICFWLSDLSLWSKLLYCVPALLGCSLDISNLTCPKRIFDFHSSRQFSIPVNAIIIHPIFLVCKPRSHLWFFHFSYFSHFNPLESPVGFNSKILNPSTAVILHYCLSIWCQHHFLPALQWSPNWFPCLPLQLIFYVAGQIFKVKKDWMTFFA